MSLHDKLAKTRAGNKGNGWRPKENENRVRILPPRSRYLEDWDAMDDLAIAYEMHFFKIEGRPTEVSRCLEELKQKCPACEMWRAHRESADPGLKELAKQIRPARQYLFNILDINNLAAGIQPWSSNYTCWDKILEIAANPQWGNVVDPANGVNFTINLTPGSRAKSGHNTYSVVPEPQRTTVEAILNGIPDWRAKLDELEHQITEPKDPNEIIKLLEDMGFPPRAGVRQLATPVPVASVPPVPAPTAAPAPAPAATAMPTPVPAAAPTPVAAPAPAVVTPTAEPRPVANVSTPATQSTAPHYDPGDGYVEKVPAAERPAGAPRCFGDYDPRKHVCQPCKSLTDCQLKMIGVPPMP